MTLVAPHFQWQDQTVGPVSIRPLPEEEPTYSFIIPAYNEEASIATAVLAVEKTVHALGIKAEMLIIDDGSTDETFARATNIQTGIALRVFQLSRNFGKEQAIAAGLSKCAGDAAIILDADLQEPLSYLTEMLEHYRSGYDMVFAVRKHRRDETRIKRLLCRLFYATITVGQEFDIPPNARDFRIMDRKVIDALNALPERNRFMKGLYGWVGFRSKAVPIEVAPRIAGSSKFRLGGLTKLALTGLTSFSNWPLRIWTGVGAFFSTLAIGYALWIFVSTLIWGRDVPGFATLAFAILFLGGLQLISIGVLGEYLARVFTEVKGRPGYIIAQEAASGELGC